MLYWGTYCLTFVIQALIFAIRTRTSFASIELRGNGRNGMSKLLILDPRCFRDELQMIDSVIPCQRLNAFDLSMKYVMIESRNTFWIPVIFIRLILTYFTLIVPLFESCLVVPAQLHRYADVTTSEEFYNLAATEKTHETCSFTICTLLHFLNFPYRLGNARYHWDSGFASYCTDPYECYASRRPSIKITFPDTSWSHDDSKLINQSNYSDLWDSRILDDSCFESNLKFTAYRFIFWKWFNYFHLINSTQKRLIQIQYFTSQR